MALHPLSKSSDEGFDQKRLNLDTLVDAYILVSYGQEYLNAYQWQKAEQSFREAITEAAQDNEVECEARQQLAMCLLHQERYKDSIAEAELATKAARHCKERTLLNALRLESSAHLDYQQGEPALVAIAEALELASGANPSLPNTRLELIIKRAIANALLGNLFQAQDDLDHALHLLNQQAWHQSLWLAYRQATALLYEKQQDFANALAARRQAVSLARQIAQSLKETNPLAPLLIAGTLKDYLISLQACGHTQEATAVAKERKKLLRQCGLPLTKCWSWRDSLKLLWNRILGAT